ncbi:MAG TPA: hypothetical protein VGM44_06240 [Polyangiaceae bacterium]|jgi:hypothetical protein
MARVTRAIRNLTLACTGIFGLCMLAACRGKSKPTPVVVGSTTLPAPVASSLPIDPRVVSQAVNPKGEAPYNGPTGTIRGTVVTSGDEAPTQPQIVAKIPADCASARDFYGKLFREGPGRALADAIVGVTGYSGYVPEDVPSQLADATGCAWSARTYVLTFGQSLDVRSRDSRAYVPDLIGATLKAQLVAVPRGDAIHLYPEHTGRFELIDSMRLFMAADVVVVSYPTHAVTGIDGSFVIPHIPVGKVTVSTVLPATAVQISKQVELHAGESVEVKLELPFDLKRWEAMRSGAGVPAPSVSAR